MHLNDFKTAIPPLIGQIFMVHHRYNTLAWEKWLEMGVDTDSIVSDPLFLDPKYRD